MKELLGRDTPEPYQLHSEEFKEFALRANGCFDCPEAEIAYIIEMQGYQDPHIYHRAEIERLLADGMASEEVVLPMIDQFREELEAVKASM